MDERPISYLNSLSSYVSFDVDEYLRAIADVYEIHGTSIDSEVTDVHVCEKLWCVLRQTSLNFFLLTLLPLASPLTHRYE